MLDLSNKSNHIPKCSWKHFQVKLPSVARLLRNQPVASKPSEGKGKHLSRGAKAAEEAKRNLAVIKFEPMILSFHQIAYEVSTFLE